MILQFLIAWLATSINRHQDHVIAYLRQENRILKAKLKGRRMQLTDAERRRLAVLAHSIARKDLKDLATLATPDTLRRWYCRLVDQAPSPSRQGKSLGRPRVIAEIEQLAVRMAHENPTWGYRRIQGALSNLGYHIHNTTVRTILRHNHIDPAPLRGKAGMSWTQFVKRHLAVLQATGFFEARLSAVVPHWTVRTQQGRDLSAQGVQLIGLICQDILRVSTRVAQQGRVLGSGCITHVDVRYPLILSRRQGVLDRALPTLHLVSSQPVVLQIDARPMKQKRSPPEKSTADSPLAARRTALGCGVSPLRLVLESPGVVGNRKRMSSPGRPTTSEANPYQAAA